MGYTQSFPYDFKDIEDRHDVATYTSALLQEDLTITGDVVLDLYHGPGRASFVSLPVIRR